LSIVTPRCCSRPTADPLSNTSILKGPSQQMGLFCITQLRLVYVATNQDPRYKHSGMTFCVGADGIGPFLPHGPTGPTARGTQSTTPNPPHSKRGRRENDTPRAALLSGTGQEKRTHRGGAGVCLTTGTTVHEKTDPPRKGFFCPFCPSKKTIPFWLCRNEPRSPIQAFGDDAFRRGRWRRPALAPRAGKPDSAGPAPPKQKSRSPEERPIHDI